jgi:hypothetical protein
LTPTPTPYNIESKSYTYIVVTRLQRKYKTMYHDIKKPSDRVRPRDRKPDQITNHTATTVVLIILVIALYLMAGHYDFQAIQAGI